MNDFKHWKLTEDFTKIPNELITDGSLSVTQRLILIYIKSHKEDYIYTVEQIAESLGLNINTVKINLRKLESMNIIKQEKIAQSSNYHRSVTKDFHQERGFTRVSNKFIKNNELDVYEKLLFIYFSGRPREWNYSQRKICKILNISRDKLLKSISVLEKKDYLKVEIKDDNTHDYILFFNSV